MRCTGMVTLCQQPPLDCPPIGRHSIDHDENHNLSSSNPPPLTLEPEKSTIVPVNQENSLVVSCSEDESSEEENDIDTWAVGNSVVQQEVRTESGDVILPGAEPSSFGDVCVKNSTNVHLGNKTFYKGPVTIKQFVYASPAAIQPTGIVKCEPGRVSDGNASDLSGVKVEAGADKPILPHGADYDKVRQWLWTWKCAAFLCVVALVLLIAVAISVYFTRNGGSSPAPVFPKIPDSFLGGVTPKNVRFVERNEWGAQPPSEQLKRMKLPVPYVIISHTVTDFCSTQSECTFHVRFAQTFHIESRNWSDIAYNFLVGGDGLAYVGRSWDYMGAHSFGYNNISIGISFIGTFNSVIPPKRQLHAAQQIIALGVEGGKIAKNYKLLGHRQISQTLSPGDALYSVIQKWPHWSPTP